MRGYILVLQNPYFAVSNDSGTYTIASGPAGTYTLAVWHEHFVGPSREIRVAEGGDLVVAFALASKAPAVRAPSPRKPEERQPWT